MSLSHLSSVFPPAEFFRPAGAAIPAPPRSRNLRLTRSLRLTSQTSWASQHSPAARSKMLSSQVGEDEEEVWERLGGAETVVTQRSTQR